MRLSIALKAAWALVLVLLILGATLPMFTFSKFYFFNDTFSLLSGIFHLLDEGEPVLFVLVFTFSILLPVYKMYLLGRIIFHRAMAPDNRHRCLHFLHILGKWSMLDVFVVALLVMTVKFGVIADVTVHAGLYVFAAGVLASMLLTHGVAVAATAPVS